MTLNVAIQMDSLAGIDIRGDTSFALGLEAQRRGHSLFVYGPEHLSMAIEGGRLPKDSVMAKGRETTLKDVVGAHYEEGEVEQLHLIESDVVLMRQDPPFDMQYITATHLLNHIHPETLVVNNPSEVRDAPEKLLVTSFPELMPPTLISRDWDEIRSFRDAHKDIIVKPLFGSGGAGVFHLREGDDNFASLLEMMLSGREPLMTQAYLSAVRAGDKRVILIDGEAVGALNRVPPEGESRSNMHVGGVPEAIDLDDADYRIVEAIGPELKKRGLIFSGIDVIGGYLTEINVTSPTGIREIERFTGVNLASQIWDSIESKL